MSKTMDFDAALAGQQPQNPGPADNIFAGLEPPAEAFAGIDAKYGKQHVVLVLDVSGSMGAHGKIDESNVAKGAFVNHTAVPENKDGILITEITFNDQATRRCFAQSAVGLKLKPAKAGGGTSFENALTAAHKAVMDLERRPNPDGYKFYRPAIIKMSDGHSIASDATIQKVHEVADVIAVAFGTDANTAMLAKIASDGQVHKVGTNGGELSKFLAKVGQTLSDEFQAARV